MPENRECFDGARPHQGIAQKVPQGFYRPVGPADTPVYYHTAAFGASGRAEHFWQRLVDVKPVLRLAPDPKGGTYAHRLAEAQEVSARQREQHARAVLIDVALSCRKESRFAGPGFEAGVVCLSDGAQFEPGTT